MAVNIDKIKALLGQGLPNETVASAVGCSASYITQLLADELFSAEVQELKIKRLSNQTDLDDRAERIEGKLLEAIEAAIDHNGFIKPRDALMAYRVINGGKRRGAGKDIAGGQHGGQVVPLVLPVQVFQHLTIASNGEVVGVNGKSTATITPGKLLSNLRESATNEVYGASYKRIAGSLPNESSPNED